jgi:hypothetical protein
MDLFQREPKRTATPNEAEPLYIRVVIMPMIAIDPLRRR